MRVVPQILVAAHIRKEWMQVLDVFELQFLEGVVALIERVVHPGFPVRLPPRLLTRLLGCKMLIDPFHFLLVLVVLYEPLGSFE